MVVYTFNDKIASGGRIGAGKVEINNKVKRSI
jgi:hypothetical protein